MDKSKWLERGLEEARKEFEGLPKWMQGREPIDEVSKEKVRGESQVIEMSEKRRKT